MSTKLLNVRTAPQNKWEEIFSHDDYNEEIKHEAQILMFRFLGEIEKFQDLQGIKKKTLADKIKTSPSYITQLFRGHKPLNFETIAKIQKALKIAFRISAKQIGDEIEIDEKFFLDITAKYKVPKEGFWVYKNIENANYSDECQDYDCTESARIFYLTTKQDGNDCKEIPA